MRAIILSICLVLSCTLWADSPGYVTALDNGVSDDLNNQSSPPAFATAIDADAMMQCVQQVNMRCSAQIYWEQKESCIKQALLTLGARCQQANVIEQKFGLLPNKVQSLGVVSVFTLLHPADGQETFHMIDGTGALIDLVDDRDAAIASSAEFKKIQKKNAQAGLTPWVADSDSETPQMIQPKMLGNKKGEDVVQLIFKQYINAPPCLACQHAAVAEIAYLFSAHEGKFIGVKWLKTELNK